MESAYIQDQEGDYTSSEDRLRTVSNDGVESTGPTLQTATTGISTTN